METWPHLDTSDCPFDDVAVRHQVGSRNAGGLIGHVKKAHSCYGIVDNSPYR